MWDYITIFGGASAAGWFLGATYAGTRWGRIIAAKEIETAVLKERYDQAVSHHADDVAAREVLSRVFADLSLEALGRNSEQFLQLADQALQRRLDVARTELDSKQETFGLLSGEIRTALTQMNDKLQVVEKERARHHGDLSRHIDGLKASTERLGLETARLHTALRGTKVQGHWGEAQLRNIVEAIGLSSFCDFREQQTSSDGGRPDLIVQLPQGRKIVIDAKVSLTPLLELGAADSDETRRKNQREQAKALRSHIKSLADRDYPAGVADALDLTLLFLPAESLLAWAIEGDNELIQYAHERRILLVTPTSLSAFLSLVNSGWQEVRAHENAREILNVGAELYRRLSAFTEHMSKLGRSLGTAVRDFNTASGSLESRVIVQARRLEGTGICSGEGITPPHAIESQARTVASSH